MTSSADEGGLLIDDLIEWIDEQIDADPTRRRGPSRPPRSRTDSRADGARVLPALPDDPRGWTSSPDKLLRGARAWAGISYAHAQLTARWAPPRHASRRGPRLSLRGRPVGDLPPPPAPGGGALRRHPAGLVSAPPGALVHCERDRSSHVEQGDPHAARPQVPGASGLEAGRR